MRFGSELTREFARAKSRGHRGASFREHFTHKIDNKADFLHRLRNYLSLAIMRKLITLFACLLICVHLHAQHPSTEITYSPEATHIARINNDTIVVISGSTYRFTVDTPEDQGLFRIETSVADLLKQIQSKNGLQQSYQVNDAQANPKKEGVLVNGDLLEVKSANHKKKYFIKVERRALSGRLVVEQPNLTINSPRNIILYYSAGQRSPKAIVRIFVPKPIAVTMANTTVNIIGRGDVFLRDLSKQSIGRVGTKYSYSRVGDVAITQQHGGSLITLSNLDLRPANGPDLKIVIKNVQISKVGEYAFNASYTTAQPEMLNSAGTALETAAISVRNTISDLQRVVHNRVVYSERKDTYNSLQLKWTNGIASGVDIMHSLDTGKTWKLYSSVSDKSSTITINTLIPNRLHSFRLRVAKGHRGYSNIVHFYSGKLDVKTFGISGNDSSDNTIAINNAIEFLSGIGGGTLLFSKGVYHVRTVHLKSNVYLFVEKDATIKAIKGADAPETTWFSDKKYRSGLSPTDEGPYADPENYLTKQDVGHHYFRNTMFFAERQDNIRIIGNGMITGNGNLVTGDRVMNNAPDNRADKMFVFKLCTNVEIGGIRRDEDLWYDEKKDEPYYISKDGSRDFNTRNMLNIDRAGHFVLLATGTDNIDVHNTYFAKHNSSNARDIYDFMACNNVTVTNIYSKVSSDDIVKPGSDCSLGFTRPARNYKVRNVIGDTNCNLFQVGSETADDIMDIHVDNIYVLGANKAGFSISTNDGAHIKDIHLNCGHTGKIHSRSKMLRTFAPFFISISNRGRILGAEVGKYQFSDNGELHNELLVKNVNIGRVENIILNGIDITEVYGGSSYGNRSRWKAFDGTQKRATAIVAGYSLPNPEAVQGKLDFKLPNGLHTGYITNVVFNDVHLLVKGGNPLSDTAASPPELGVGQYNVSNLKTQPSYGLWARHVKDLFVINSSFNYESRDSRYAIFLDDVKSAKISGVKMVSSTDNKSVLKLKNSEKVTIENAIYYSDVWGNQPLVLSTMR